MSHGKKKYSITELISDERFQNYCLQKNKQDEEYWKSIILQNWNQREVFEQAYISVRALTNENVYSTKKKEVKVISINQTPKSSNLRNMFWFINGSVAIVVLFFLIFNLSDKTNYIKISSGIGETKNVILPDSTRIKLNSNSILVYEESMRKTREVQLVGEGYFDVITLPNLAPFIVRTQHGNIEVTGTSFNVRSRKELFESTLIEGGITFKREGKNDVLLLPGDHLNISNNSLQITSEEVDSKIAWKDGRLFFKRASIDEISKRLKDDYGLSVIVENRKLKDKKINANILTSNPMDLLESIAAIYDFSIVKVTKDKVILK